MARVNGVRGLCRHDGSEWPRPTCGSAPRKTWVVLGVKGHPQDWVSPHHSLVMIFCHGAWSVEQMRLPFFPSECVHWSNPCRLVSLRWARHQSGCSWQCALANTSPNWNLENVPMWRLGLSIYIAGLEPSMLSRSLATRCSCSPIKRWGQLACHPSGDPREQSLEACDLGLSNLQKGWCRTP